MIDKLTKGRDDIELIDLPKVSVEGYNLSFSGLKSHISRMIEKDKEEKKQVFNAWLIQYWNVVYECCDKSVDAHHTLVKLAEVMGNFFSENFNLHIYNTVQNIMTLVREHLTFTGNGGYVANNVKQSGAGFGVDTNVVTLITAEGEKELPQMSKEQVAGAILDALISIQKKVSYL